MDKTFANKIDKDTSIDEHIKELVNEFNIINNSKLSYKEYALKTGELLNFLLQIYAKSNGSDVYSYKINDDTINDLWNKYKIKNNTYFMIYQFFNYAKEHKGLNFQPKYRRNLIKYDKYKQKCCEAFNSQIIKENVDAIDAYNKIYSEIENKNVINLSNIIEAESKIHAICDNIKDGEPQNIQNSMRIILELIVDVCMKAGNKIIVRKDNKDVELSTKLNFLKRNYKNIESWEQYFKWIPILNNYSHANTNESNKRKNPITYNEFKNKAVDVWIDNIKIINRDLYNEYHSSNNATKKTKNIKKKENKHQRSEFSKAILALLFLLIGTPLIIFLCIKVINFTRVYINENFISTGSIPIKTEQNDQNQTDQNQTDQNQTDSIKKLESYNNQKLDSEEKYSATEVTELDKLDEEYIEASFTDNFFSFNAGYLNHKLYIRLKNDSTRPVKLGAKDSFKIEVYIGKNSNVYDENSVELAPGEELNLHYEIETENPPTAIKISSFAFNNRGKYDKFIRKRVYFNKLSEKQKSAEESNNKNSNVDETEQNEYTSNVDETEQNEYTSNVDETEQNEYTSFEHDYFMDAMQQMFLRYTGNNDSDMQVDEDNANYAHENNNKQDNSKFVFGEKEKYGLKISIDQNVNEQYVLHFEYKGKNTLQYGWVAPAYVQLETDSNSYTYDLSEYMFQNIRTNDTGDIYLDFGEVEGTPQKLSLCRMIRLDNRGLPVGVNANGFCIEMKLKVK